MGSSYKVNFETDIDTAKFDTKIKKIVSQKIVKEVQLKVDKDGEESLLEFQKVTTRAINEAGKLVNQIELLDNEGKLCASTVKILDENIDELAIDSKVASTHVNKLKDAQGNLQVTTTKLNKSGQELGKTTRTTSNNFDEIAKKTKVVSTTTDKYIDSNGKAVTSIKHFNHYGEQVGDTITKTNKTIKEQSNQMKAVTTETRKYANANGDLVTEVKKFDKVGNQVGDTITKINGNMKDVSKSTDKVGQNFVGVLGKVALFGVATSVISTFTQGVMLAGQETKTLDDSLVELRKVSDLSNEGLSQYKDEAYDLARELSTTASNVTDATALFVQAGETLNSSMDLSKSAIMLQTISDNEMEIGDASSFLISTMKSFNMTAKDSEHIINAVNEVDILAFPLGNIWVIKDNYIG